MNTGEYNTAADVAACIRKAVIQEVSSVAEHLNTLLGVYMYNKACMTGW